MLMEEGIKGFSSGWEVLLFISRKLVFKL